MLETRLESVLEQLATGLPAEQMDELLTAIEEQQSRMSRDLQIREHEISELNRLVEDLSRENQVQSQEIVSLNTRIVRMSGSDKELQESLKIRKEADAQSNENNQREQALMRAQQALIRQQRDLNFKKKRECFTRKKFD